MKMGRLSPIYLLPILMPTYIRDRTLDSRLQTSGMTDSECRWLFCTKSPIRVSQFRRQSRRSNAVRCESHCVVPQPFVESSFILKPPTAFGGKDHDSRTGLSIGACFMVRQRYAQTAAHVGKLCRIDIPDDTSHLHGTDERLFGLPQPMALATSFEYTT